MVDFRERLAAAMAHAGAGSAELAEHLEISPQALRKIEVGTSKSLSAENCARASRFLGVSYFWLATGEGEMAPRAATTLAVNEPPGRYDVKVEWPFDSLRPTEYARLTERQKGMVEGYARALITANCNHPPHATPRAAA